MDPAQGTNEHSDDSFEVQFTLNTAACLHVGVWDGDHAPVLVSFWVGDHAPLWFCLGFFWTRYCSLSASGECGMATTPPRSLVEGYYCCSSFYMFTVSMFGWASYLDIGQHF